MDTHQLGALACAGKPVAALRLERGALHLHACGPRPVAEFLAEIGRTLDAEEDILAALDRWRMLSPELVRAVGANTFAPRPLTVVPPQEGAA